MRQVIRSSFSTRTKKGIEGTWGFVSVVVAADDGDDLLEARRNGNVVTAKTTTAQATIR